MLVSHIGPEEFKADLLEDPEQVQPVAQAGRLNTQMLLYGCRRPGNILGDLLGGTPRPDRNLATDLLNYNLEPGRAVGMLLEIEEFISGGLLEGLDIFSKTWPRIKKVQGASWRVWTSSAMARKARVTPSGSA